MKILSYIKKFITKVEATPEETVKSPAFCYNIMPISPAVHLMAFDTFKLTYTDPDGNKHIFEEKAKVNMTVNSFGIIRFQDAFGMKQGIGGIIGEMTNEHRRL